MERKYEAQAAKLVPYVKKWNLNLKKDLCKLIYPYVVRICGSWDTAIKVTSMLVDLPFITLAEVE